LPGTNTLAYYGNPYITAVISFIIQAPQGQYYKNRIIVTVALQIVASLSYDRNYDSRPQLMLTEPSITSLIIFMIVSSLTLINNDHHLDHNVFIEQGTDLVLYYN
jgi:hypothetical protein